MQTNARFIREYPNLREYVKDMYHTHGGAIGRRWGGGIIQGGTTRCRGPGKGGMEREAGGHLAQASAGAGARGRAAPHQ